VPELTHDGSEDGFHEIQLSGKQVVFLFMVTTVVSVMIFLCGVLVGRGVRADRGTEVDSAPIAEASTPGTPVTATPPASTSTAEVSPPKEAPAPPAQDELSYQADLQGKGKGKGAAALKPQEQAPAQSSPAPSTPEPAPAPAPKVEAAPQGAADVPTAGRSGTWVLQITALENRGAANAMARRFISKGYPAFVFPPPAGTPQIFRVQIGKYSDRREAEQVARRLEKEEKLRAVIKR
jgi:septal ring-binding cell division protein DamX